VVAKGDNAAITIPFLPRPTMDSQLAFVRLPTALRVETTPFIKAIWQGDNDPAFAVSDGALRSSRQYSLLAAVLTPVIMCVMYHRTSMPLASLPIRCRMLFDGGYERMPMVQLR